MTTSIRVAILDDRVPAQLRERPTEAEGLELVWTGTSYDELLRTTGRISPQVIVAALDRLGDDPSASIDRLLAASGAELFVTIYEYASRAEIERLTGPNRRVLRAPVSIPMLKTHMMGAIVRGLLSESAGARPARPTPPRPIQRAAQNVALPEPPRYTDAQLATLRERQSKMACECPNHVAELVSSLIAFERYSRACANRDDDDAAMHRALASATADARRSMERVLGVLLNYERIVV